MRQKNKKFTRIFFATDIHGSETCFMKFINAGKFYKANILIMGGDITGKVIVPICRKAGDTYEAEFMGKIVYEKGVTGLSSLTKRIGSVGFYPHVMDEEEIGELRTSPKKLDELFSKVMEETLQRWLREAEKRLQNTGISCYISPGNDDRFEIDYILGNSDVVQCPEGKLVKLTDDIEMISTGFANTTPWSCPRDIPEEELAQKIENMTSKVQNMSRCVFNLHAPPHGTGLDSAPQLDSTFKPMTKAGTIMITSVGSTAVREAILKHQPMIGLHGHIHESRSVCKIGRTLSYNPGSEYTEGMLRGVLITIGDEGVMNDFFTCG